METNLNLRIITTIIITIYMSSHVAAQSPATNYSYDSPIGMTPAMILILVSIVAVFLLMGCLSMYVRRYVDYDDAADGTTLFFYGSNTTVDGLDQAIVGSFPTFLYSEVKGFKIGKGTLECAICLCEFEDLDTLRLLPKCCHVFHQECIDTWLNNNVTCPVCRAMLVPLPGETNNFVLPLHEPKVLEQANSCHMADDDIIIDIQSQGPANRTQAPKQSLPPRSTSRKKRLFGIFNRSFTTGHVVVQPGNDYSRFTLRLPQEVRSKLVSRSPSQAKGSAVLLPRERSKRNGYRSASVGATNGRSLLNFEQFEPEGNPGRWWFMKTPSISSRSGSARSAKWVAENSEAQQLDNAPQSLLRSVNSPFSCTLPGMSGSIKEDVNVGEQSFDRLIRFDGDEV